jgi:hypothetical protein
MVIFNTLHESWILPLVLFRVSGGDQAVKTFSIACQENSGIFDMVAPLVL